ncbi:hypothetical protein F7644_12330 [Tenacibaculum finnmarkense genomovar ulcerans]|uniref:Uncharacterized protein n=1 Tax=Tenacibaculum finnmarkense genomovar ulcerans TaxID=2781388 RepID=A0A2I2MBL8_9FLAO|nr:hypothetical protein [Tenacibaculum finnmarkense]MBE7646767.1 hypothetical protein [Tenacibaculum finnmarkense genomovar ulcerans]SOU89440.1 hypothetical protein TNO010_400015 [Tenacibaculum finnmarkense genomovar ulcerans]
MDLKKEFKIKEIDGQFFIFKGNKKYKTHCCESDSHGNAVVSRIYKKHLVFNTLESAKKHFTEYVLNNKSCKYRGYTILHLYDYFKNRELFLCKEDYYIPKYYNVMRRKYWQGSFVDGDLEYTKRTIDKIITPDKPKVYDLN